MVEDAVWVENAPQIYMRLIDNDLYVYLNIGRNMGSTTMGQPKLTDVFTDS